MFETFNHRSTALERLDTGDYTQREYARWQREMWYIHRFFGEIRAMRKTVVADLQRSGKSLVSVLDVGAGDGGLLKALETEVREMSLFSIGVELSFDATRSIRDNDIVAIQADAMSLPFGDGAFDVSVCSLFLHHLGPTDAVRLLREMARVARCVYVIDLNREPLPYYLYRVFAPIFFQRFTVEDGALSILRAYRPEEMVDLAAKAGLREVSVTRSRLNRLVLKGTV